VPRELARELLLNESRHRIKNTLATVQAIATQTLSQTSAGALQTFLARLHALGEAHVQPLGVVLVLWGTRRRTLEWSRGSDDFGHAVGRALMLTAGEPINARRRRNRSFP
jgi:HWE histidine kinase